ncbi:hypothetical protein TCDM_02822 [Trypanosoma cruzi Dm28c]|uniref:Uncharacterized protein n=1 Tax=Trypanosoma cruzi Dm28c TaxID=1416333 RepID=V5BKW6_TRYCR|nr:hypothetical protein TCDM_02822 [Trypanosoma cruzi Dm28c]
MYFQCEKNQKKKKTAVLACKNRGKSDKKYCHHWRIDEPIRGRGPTIACATRIKKSPLQSLFSAISNNIGHAPPKNPSNKKYAMPPLSHVRLIIATSKCDGNTLSTGVMLGRTCLHPSFLVGLGVNRLFCESRKNFLKSLKQNKTQ